MKFLLTITLLAGCAQLDTLDVELGETTQGLEADNGEKLNGTSLNGEKLNGPSTNGEKLNSPYAGAFALWTSLEGVTIGGVALDTATLSATEFSGTRGTETFSGADFEGAEFVALRGDDTTTTMRIVDAIAPASGSTKWSYLVFYQETDGYWYPICFDATGRLPAYPLNGTWDHRQGATGGGAHTDDATKFTFACKNTGSLGKCVDAGYEPWRSHENVPLADHHQACTRMLRADYCGNGQPYTTTGRRVNLYDDIGIQIDTTDWGFEAEWTANGAACLTTHRRATVNVPCYDPQLEPTCGQLEHFQAGTLVMNEIP